MNNFRHIPPMPGRWSRAMRQGARAQRDGLDLLRDNPYKRGLDARGRDVAAEWTRGWLAAAQGDEPPDLDTEGDGGGDGDF